MKNKTDTYLLAQETADFLLSRITKKPSAGIILGTGLGSLVEEIEEIASIPYENIPHFPVSTVKSHQGKLIVGKLSGKIVLMLAGRFHYYEGYSARELTFPIYVLKLLGIKNLLITNVAGGLNPHYEEGDIIIVRDHINMMPDHPLRGHNDERLGPRFPDMKRAYSLELVKIAEKAYSNLGYYPKEGVYIGLQGPSLETPAEYTFLRKMGGDLVGMSTVPEVIVANHAQIPVLVLSMVSNVCFPPSRIQETTIDSVIATANRAAPILRKIVKECVRLI